MGFLTAISPKRKGNDDPLGKRLYELFLEKYGPEFEGEGFIGHNGRAYWVKKDGSYREDYPDENKW